MALMTCPLPPSLRPQMMSRQVVLLRRRQEHAALEQWKRQTLDRKLLQDAQRSVVQRVLAAIISRGLRAAVTQWKATAIHGQKLLAGKRHNNALLALRQEQPQLALRLLLSRLTKQLLSFAVSRWVWQLRRVRVLGSVLTRLGAGALARAWGHWRTGTSKRRLAATRRQYEELERKLLKGHRAMNVRSLVVQLLRRNIGYAWRRWAARVGGWHLMRRIVYKLVDSQLSRAWAQWRAVAVAVWLTRVAESKGEACACVRARVGGGGCNGVAHRVFPRTARADCCSRVAGPLQCAPGAQAGCCAPRDLPDGSSAASHVLLAVEAVCVRA